ncbi:MAG: DUF72 domain-containing protein [Sphingomonas sanxanigenens]|uniref:DUF72 domain-containing protein n=1 Tax=Sphingomonas sanxanigenens TaxID=397260 RepID=A0A2W5AD43_9SPHN|nr:MAG: DUF72 domain-containing protein [Sphingomonas sanxanigenens]
MSGRIRIGIGGWTYEPWRGTFFPPGLPHAQEIDFATRAMTAIEVNGTYYSSQKPATFAKWAKAAPDGFVYALKASRFCTNRKVLGEGGESVMKFLGQGIVELGDKLGPILWQFMATKKFDPDDFAAFLKLLPASHGGLRLRHAIEVRHESFVDPALYALADAAGVAIVHADKPDYPSIEQQTADFTYVRFQAAREEIATGYDAVELDAMADRARVWAASGDVFIFMINGAKVRAPAAAQALIERVGR